MSSSTYLVLRLYLMSSIAILGLSLYHCHVNAASIPFDSDIKIGERIALNAEDAERIERALQMKLMQLMESSSSSNKNHTTFELVRMHLITVRLTVGLMYETIAQVKFNESIVYNCAIELWVMPVLDANKFQMKCNDNGDDDDADKQHEYQLIDGGLRQMNANETLEFREKFATTLHQLNGQMFNIALMQVISAQRVAVNGFIDLARVILYDLTSNKTMDCVVEAWGTSLLFHHLNVACDSIVYKVNFKY